MSARDDLAGLIGSKLDSFFGVREFGPAAQDYTLATALLVAGYRKPRTITTADELLALPEASVVLDHEGDVSQKRDGLWCGYETAPINSNKLARLASPFTVLHEPQP